MNLLDLYYKDMCHVCGQTPCNCTHIAEEKVRLDPKCWKGKKIGNPKTKMKGGVRVNNCVPAESVAEAASAAQQAAIAINMKKHHQKPKNENYDNGEYSDEAGMAHGNLITIAKAAEGLLHTIDRHEDLPEWVQEKIAKVEGMLVTAWNYLQSQEAQGIDPRVTEMYANLAENWQRVSHRLELNQEFDLIESIVESIADRNGVDAEAVWADLESLTEDELYVFAVTSEPIMEDWQKANKRDKTDGMSRKAVKAYRREHPGSKLQTAVTTKPSKLKKGSKASKRRKSYCSRSRGQMKMHSISCSKTPDKAICKARRRWNCEGVDRSDQTVVAEADKLKGTPVVSLSDFSDKDNTKDRYGRTVPKKLKKDDPRVRFHKDYSQHEKKLISKMSNAEKANKGWRNPNIDEQGVAEGLPKAVPSSQRDPGALATRSHIASQEKAHTDWAAKQKALADEFYKNHPELDDRPKPVAQENSMADELARMAMRRNPNALVRKDGETLQSAPPGPKPAGTTTPRPAPKFDPVEYSDDYSVWSKKTQGLGEGVNDIIETHRKLSSD